MVKRAVTEAEKMKKVPGIIFVDGAAGRCARIAGTGLEVFEIIKALETCNNDRAAVAEAFETLAPEQLHAAFEFYEQFPEEIDERLAREAEITPEYVRAWNASIGIPEDYGRRR